MAYHRSSRYRQRIAQHQQALQEGRARARMAREPVQRWHPPDLRRRLIVEDYDTGAVVRTIFELHATTRIDCYHVSIDGKQQPGRIGWTRLLSLLRKAIPRKCSARWMEEIIR